MIVLVTVGVVVALVGVWIAVEVHRLREAKAREAPQVREKPRRVPRRR
jgi:hypothetical protein